MGWALPVGALFLLLLAASKTHAYGSRPLALPPGKDKAKPLNTKVHHGFYPPAGSVEVYNDPSWKWDGKAWLHNGNPEFPGGRFLHGVPNGKLDGWVYDWHLQAWVEPGTGDRLHHKNFFPPAGAVGVKGDASWIWDGQGWSKNGVPQFPQGKELEGIKGTSFEGWKYDWNEQAWIEPSLLTRKQDSGGGITSKIKEIFTSKSAPAKDDVQKPSSIRTVSSTMQDYSSTPSTPSPTSSIKTISSTMQSTTTPTKANVASAIITLKNDPDPHPQQIANVAAMASSAGLHETASALSTVAVQKAADKGIPLGETSTIRTITPLSNAQRIQEQKAFEKSVDAFAHSADPVKPAMTFEPEIITRTPDAPPMVFEPEVIHQTMSSPLAEADDRAWTDFASALEDPNNKVNDRWELGIFKIGARRLQDLGMAKDSRQVQRDGKTVWIADFIEPLSMQIFVNDEHMQYDTFVKEMQYLSNGIENRGKDGKIPLAIHGVAPTRSGLLAVAKLAGLQGLDSFMKDNGDWDKFPNTRDAFLKANGIF